MRLESIPEPRCPKYPSLDIWRGVACLMVVIYHSTYFACRDAEVANDAWSTIIAATGHLWVGVPIFFVISGYCISATADSSRRRRNSAKSYFFRRFRRIYPPYWAAALAYLAFILAVAPLTDRMTSGHVNWGIPSPFEFSVSQLIGNTALIESWRNHVAGSPQKYFIEPSWTLCYEEQFYAVTGLILLVAPRRYFSAAALITILSIAARLTARRQGLSIGGFFFDGHWVLFAAGILVYYEINYAGKAFSVCANVMLAMVTAAALIGIGLRSGGGSIVTEGVTVKIFVGAGFALLILILHRWDAALVELGVSRPFLWSGKMCYSLYLIHLPLTVGLSNLLHNVGVQGSLMSLLVTVPLCLMASLLCAWAFYNAVERRFLNAPQFAR